MCAVCYANDPTPEKGVFLMKHPPRHIHGGGDEKINFKAIRRNCFPRNRVLMGRQLKRLYYFSGVYLRAGYNRRRSKRISSSASVRVSRLAIQKRSGALFFIRPSNKQNTPKSGDSEMRGRWRLRLLRRGAIPSNM